MILSDAIKKIRKIQIVTSRAANDLFAGHYRSAFKGRGLEFGELRQYHPGDEIRFIDWNVTARTGRPHVKKFIEERELTVLFLLDVSPSCRFGTVNHLKSQLAAELCALLSFTALRNNDKIGLMLFTDRMEKFIPPKKGSRQALRIIREALYFQPEGRGTDIAAALDYLNRVLKRRTVAFVLSDFHAPDFKKPLAVTAKRHDVIAVTIDDPAEKNLPDAGIVHLSDAETEKSILIDTGDAGVREAYRMRNIERLDLRRRMFHSIGVDNIALGTDLPYVEPVIRFFRTREGRRPRYQSSFPRRRESRNYSIS
ncbi:MAG: DUF58 domain-containing protein [Deltaproteobacteria bacterium]|nr:DUF58 domain-containing protein [Deltaproteobacteria bacterium]